MKKEHTGWQKKISHNIINNVHLQKQKTNFGLLINTKNNNWHSK